ncbi:MAG: histidine phosphatase family protein [Desulfobacterales bacterium]|nr:histidine phosphatase family protein [Desulfobacterales bacterium]
MKTLTFVRHAKSSWKFPELADRDRPLNKRGKRDAPNMGKRLALRNFAPDVIISSPAVRALKTAKIIAKAIGYPKKKIVVEPQFYGAGSEQFLQIIRGFENHVDWVMCTGHNPTLTSLANRLYPEPIENVPTCGIVEVAFDTDSWSDIDQLEPIKFDFDYPKKDHS